MINEIRKGLNVKRFHTTHRIQEETVGHHSSNVAAILLRLDPDCSRELLVCALMHDVPEVYTGDIPAPFKWDHPDIKAGLADGEMAYMEEHNIPYYHLTDKELKLLKLADMLDLVMSSLEELGRGNNYAKQLVVNGQHYINDMDIGDELMDKALTMVYEVKAEWQLTIDK